MESATQSDPAAKPRNNRRRRLIINPALQASIIRRIALIPAMGLCVCAIVVCVFAKRLTDEAAAVEMNLPSTVPLLAAMVSFLLLSGVAIMYGALRFSHTVAGPSYRLVVSLDRIARGERDFRVRLREGDHLGEVAEAMNRMLEALEAKEGAPTSSGTASPRPAPVAPVAPAPTA